MADINYEEYSRFLEKEVIKELKNQNDELMEIIKNQNVLLNSIKDEIGIQTNNLEDYWGNVKRQSEVLDGYWKDLNKMREYIEERNNAYYEVERYAQELSAKYEEKCNAYDDLEKEIHKYIDGGINLDEYSVVAFDNLKAGHAMLLEQYKDLKESYEEITNSMWYLIFGKGKKKNKDKKDDE